MRRLALLLVACLLPFSVAAQGRPNTILVMDGSGSMWGQIDGVNKIVIARDVVAEILSDFPEDQNLGLTVYGHRVRGDCSDIETIVAPGLGTAARIVETVNGINPRGRTPMTDSIIAAAEALRYTEERATVVLVSDGIETCNPDPCAAMRVLEEAGIDFTAHVVGFDVAGEPEARAQMQCIAEETGGRFIEASNASELTEALQTIVEPEPVAVTGTFTARLDDGSAITEPVFWTVTDAGGTALVTDGGGNPFSLPGMAEGAYSVSAYWTAGEISRETQVTVAGPQDVTAEVVFPAPEVTAEITFEAVIAESGAPIESPVTWTIASAEGEVISEEGSAFALVLDEGLYRVSATRAEDNSTVSVDLVSGADPQTITARFPEIVPLASLTAFPTADLGDTIPVGWDGPEERNDWVDVAQVGAEGRTYINRTFVRDGDPANLLMPNAAGDYELRYIRAGDTRVLATRPITVEPIPFEVSAPATAVAGSVVQIDWVGPEYRNDWLDVAEVGGDNRSYINRTFARDGNPAGVRLPVTAGTYELRYQLAQGPRVMASTTIEVTPVTASVEVPETAAAGATVPVAWEGPAYRNDWIAVSVPGEDQYFNRRFVRDGNPAQVTVPTEPGTYEIRYFLAQGPTPIATTTIEVGLVAATLTVPETAVAGSTVPIGWDGPDYNADYIGVGPVGDDSYVNYSYTRDGNPAELEMPTEPGTYEVKYFLQQDDSVIARATIELTEVAATLSAPESAAAGATVPVTWTGPDYQSDYIGVGPVGDDSYENYRYTRDGDPAELEMPTEPGDYEIKYFLQQDNSVVARRAISVGDVEATVSAPATATAGAVVPVAWTGPDYQSDYIGIGPVGDDSYENYRYTRDGDPAELRMPTEPGTYEIKYFLQQDNSVIARTTITLEAIKAELQAPATAVVGETVAVTWEGPDYDGDYIGVGLIGNDRYTSYRYTRDGNPAGVVMPPEPGSYELRYYISQGNRIVARQAIEVSDIAATLVAPPQGTAGGTLIVGWDGPDYDRDYIGVSRPGEPGYLTYTYTRSGNPLEVTLPEEPGSYELRYFMANGDRVLGTFPITVE